MSRGVEVDARLAYKAVSDYVNGWQHYKDLFADELLHDHKLLQTYVMQLFFHCIRKMAESEEWNRTAQNAWAIDKCKRIVEEVGIL